jgi:fibronectin-binding autotransporter adhesin
VNNAGTFQLSGSTGNNAAVLNNNAVFNNQAGGQILFSQPGNTLGTSSGIGTLNNSGTIASSGGNNATLTMSVFNANDGSIFTTGTGSVIRNAFSSSYDGNLTLNSALRLTGGTHVFADGVTLNGTGSVVHDGATTVTMNNVTANVPYTLTSSDTLTLAAGKTFTLGSGMTTNTASFAPVTITGGGTLEIPAGQTLLFNSNDTQFFHFNNVTVNNAGTFQLSGSTGNNAAVLNNNAVFNNQAGGQILFSQPGNTLGTSAGIGTLNNSGTIAAAGGDIVISVAVVTNSGLLDVTAGNASIPPGLALLAGSIDVGVGRNVSIGGTGLDWQGGTLTGVGTYTLSSLTITGSGARVLNGPTFTINNLSLPGGSLDVQAGTLNLTGAASTAAGSTLLVSGGSFTSTGTLANAGTFSKSSAGTTTIAAAFSNAGTVNANAGVLDFTGGYVQSAGQVMLGGGALAGNLTLNGGTLGGAGTLTGNLVNTSGIVAPGNSPGLLTVAGDYTQGAGGQLNIELGGTVAGTGYDRLSVAGNATLDGTVFVTIPGAFAPGTGDLFDFMTIGGIRSGSFATTTLPTGYTGNVSYPAGLAQLQFSAVPATAVSSTATATTTALKIAAVDLFETLDKLSPSLMPAPPLAHDDEDEENNVGVVVCK